MASARVSVSSMMASSGCDKREIMSCCGRRVERLKFLYASCMASFSQHRSPAEQLRQSPLWSGGGGSLRTSASSFSRISMRSIRQAIDLATGSGIRLWSRLIPCAALSGEVATSLLHCTAPNGLRSYHPVSHSYSRDLPLSISSHTPPSDMVHRETPHLDCCYFASQRRCLHSIQATVVRISRTPAAPRWLPDFRELKSFPDTMFKLFWYSD